MQSGKIEQNGWVICCKDCSKWDAIDFPKARCIKLWKKQGWKKVKNLWVCPDCAAGGLPINHV